MNKYTFFLILFLVGLIFSVSLALAQTTRSAITATDLVCFKTAMVNRETAVTTAFTNFTSTTTALLNNRATALASDWDILETKARNKAVKKAWNDYKKALSSTKKTFNLTRKAAWRQYRDAIGDCVAKISVSGLEVEGSDLSF